MDKVKIKNIQTGAIMEVKAALADDYVGTGRFVLVEETEEKAKPNSFKKEE